MKIAVVGAYQTKFGELWHQGIEDLLAESSLGSLDDARILPKDVDAIFTGNMCAGALSGQCNLGGISAQILNSNASSTVVEGACASGGLAIRAGIAAIESGQANVVLVNGVEKLTDDDPATLAAAMMMAASQELEYFHGATFPGLVAMIARRYMHELGLTRQQLSAVSVQSHENAIKNPVAHVRRKISIDDVARASMVADPLTLLDCSPVSDGAASIVLCCAEYASKLSLDAVFIIGSASASDCLTLAQREDLLSWRSTRLATQRALAEAKVGLDQVNLVELHDAFSILQIISLEDMGFFERGEAAAAIFDGKTSLNSKLPVNPSGGLKAKGHPVGATGVGQAVEVVNQLRERCGERQVVNAKIGLTHNVGGCGTVASVHVFSV